MKSKSLFLLLALTFTSLSEKSPVSVIDLNNNQQLNIVDSFENLYSDTTKVFLSGDALELVRFYDSLGILNSYKLKLIRPDENLTETYIGHIVENEILWDSSYSLLKTFSNSSSCLSFDILPRMTEIISDSYLDNKVAFLDSVENFKK